MTTQTGPDLAALSAAVEARARAVAGAAARLDGLLPEGAGPVSPTLADRRALALRMFRVVGTGTAEAVLRAAGTETVALAVLGRLLGQDRVELWETVGDLVQTGLVELEPERGTVRSTAAGRAVLDLIDSCAGGDAR